LFVMALPPHLRSEKFKLSSARNQNSRSFLGQQM
jgi:hypothetical protein